MESFSEIKERLGSTKTVSSSSSFSTFNYISGVYLRVIQIYQRAAPLPVKKRFSRTLEPRREWAWVLEGAQRYKALDARSARDPEVSNFKKYYDYF